MMQPFRTCSNYKMIRSAKSTDCTFKIRSIPINHLWFMEVHDAARSNVEGGASQQANVILAVHKDATEQKVPLSSLCWSSNKMKRVVRSSLAAETNSIATCMEQLNWMRTVWSRMTAEFSFGQLRNFFEEVTSVVGARQHKSARRDSQGRNRSFIKRTSDFPLSLPVLRHGQRKVKQTCG